MYLRHTTVRKNGKTHSYWRLVRSVRRGRRVVQETVAQLGELDGQGRARAGALALRITGREEQYELFEAPAGRSEPVAVRLDHIRLERARRFGDVWLGWRLWRALALDRFCEDRLVEGRERAPWPAIAAILVIARLCEPASELHIAEDWYRRTALDDLLGVPAERINDDRLYRALDRLLPHKQALEAHLKERLGALFDLDYELLLYDVTSTYFEGQAEGNGLARRGYSRDHRGDCKQVCIGLVVTRDGVPLGYEVFAGNRTDVTTMEEIVTTMERRYGQARRVWVMDRGMASAENIAWLRGSQRRYLIGASKSELKTTPARLPIGGTGGRCATGSKPRSAPARTEARRSFWCVRPSGSRRNGRCTRASASASRPPWRACNDASSGGKSRSTAALPSVRSDACSAATHAPRRAMRSVSSTTQSCRLACDSNGRGAPNGTTGRVTAKAATCCAPICATGAPRRCGGPISSFPRRKRPFASIRASCRSVPSGISARIACWRTSWCAFSPTCCGRRWSNGRAAPVSATVRAPSSRNSPPSPAPTSSCRRRHLPAANCDCAASCAPIAPKRSCSSASVSACPNDSACPPRRAKCSANPGP